MQPDSAEWALSHRPGRNVTSQGRSSKHWDKPVSSDDFHWELASFELFYGSLMMSLDIFGQSNDMCKMGQGAGGAKGEQRRLKSLPCFRYLVDYSAMWLVPVTHCPDTVGWEELLETTKALMHNCSKVGQCHDLHQLFVRYDWVLLC